jgi:hypothetical protein
MKRSGMRRLLQGVLLTAVILFAGCLVAAGAQSARGAVTAASPSAGAPTPATPTPPPTVASPTAIPTTPSPTAAPSTASTAPSPSPTSSSSASGLGGNLIWLWVVLGALVLLGIILLATRAPRRASPPAGTGAWHSRAVDAYAKGAAFDGAVRSAEREGVFIEASSMRWADLQRRADDLTEVLYTMRETAPTEHRRVQVENAILSLRGVRDAMDSQRFPGNAGSQQVGILRSRLAALESALNALRVPDDRLV